MSIKIARKDFVDMTMNDVPPSLQSEVVRRSSEVDDIAEMTWMLDGYTNTVDRLPDQQIKVYQTRQLIVSRVKAPREKTSGKRHLLLLYNSRFGRKCCRRPQICL